jgi:hypothetical protein
MSSSETPFDIHVHGEIPLRSDVTIGQIQEALRPLLEYAGTHMKNEKLASAYDDEPGIQLDAKNHHLLMCWTVQGDESVRYALDEMCMGLNDLAARGAPIEISFHDNEFDEDDETEEDESRDDFTVLFVGPSPAAIMQTQRDLLVEDVVALMERHFDGAELGDVVSAIDQLFASRLNSLVSSLDVSRIIRGPGNSGGAGAGSGSHGGGRKPRHLH